MPVSEREAYTTLGHYEAAAFCDGEYTRVLGTIALTITRRSRYPIAFDYKWGESSVGKHVALSAVRTFTDASR
jgi:hypothetical protein